MATAKFATSNVQSEVIVNSAHLYNGVDRLWQVLYGNHVHASRQPRGILKLAVLHTTLQYHQTLPGYTTRNCQKRYYPDAADKSERLADAQDRTVEQIMAVAGLDSRVRKVLDVGCGVGGTSCAIAKKLGCKAVGVNISASQVASANQLARQEGFLPNQVHFVEGDALQLPESVGSADFDVVLSFESACYMPDKRRFIQQLASRVEAGGKLVLVDFCRGPAALTDSQASYLAQMDQLFATAGDWHSMEEYSTMLREEGLTVTTVQDWSSHIRGFWEAGLWELFSTVPDADKGSLAGKALAVVGKMLLTGYLVLDGGWPTLKMAFTFLTAAQQRIVGGAFSSGALKYQALVAVKEA